MLGIRWWVITPSTPPIFFFSRFNLGVAMVAMVAMTREPPQRPGEPRPVREDAACRRCGARDAPSARGTGTLEHGRRAATPGGHQSWTNPTNLQRYPTSAPGCLATAPRVDFWPVATMATMATPAGQPLKKKLDSPKLVGRFITPLHPFASFFFPKFSTRGGHGGHGGHRASFAGFPPAGASC